MTRVEMSIRRRAGQAVAATTLVAMLAFLATGCGGGSGSSSETSAAKPTTSADPDTPPASGPAMTIGYSNPFAAQEGLRSVGYGAQEAIKELGLNWDLKETDAKLSPEKQVSDLESLVAQKVNGIMSWTLEEGAAESAYQRATAAGIPLIGLNSSSPSFDSVIAADTDTTCRVADQQAQYIAKLIPNAELLVIGGPPVPSVTMTTNCFIKAAKAEGLDLIETQNDTAGTPESGQEVASAMLLKHPEAEAMWVCSDSSGLGASAALKAAGKQVWSGEDSGFVLVSRDGTAAAAAAVENGELTATWDNSQPLVGAAAIQVLKYHLVEGVPLSELPSRVRIPSKIWDKSTIESYEPPLTREVVLPLPESFEKP